jgi:pyruvate/2-oxoglutarate dehydrogenase complex dihydrolipoamide acyltransferase (E2) component
MSVLSKLMTVTSVFAVVRVAGEAVDNKPAEGGDAAAAEAATTAAADDEAAAGEAAAPAPTDFAAGSVHALKKENFSVFLEKNKSGSLVEFYPRGVATANS